MGDNGWAIMEVLSHLSDGADLDNLIAIIPTPGSCILTFVITDEKEFRDVMTAINAEITTLHDYNVAKLDNTLIIFNDGQGWMMVSHSAPKAIDTIEKMLTDAGKQSVSDLSAVAECLTSGNTMNIAINTKAYAGSAGIPSELEDTWTLGNFDIAQKEITFSSTTCEADGNQMEVSGMQTINAAVLSYVPSSLNFVAAAGFTPEMEWSTLIETISSLGGFQARGVMEILSPYIRSIDGTAMIGAGIAEGLDHPQLMAMIHMPQNKINEALTTARRMIESNHVPCTIDENNMMAISLTPGETIYAGNIDGYLAVANFPFNPNQQNELAPLFVNKKSAISLNIPSLRTLSPAAPVWGVSLTVENDGVTGKGRLTLTGTDGDILPTLLKTII